jgi:hypothetical protein
VEEKQTVDVVAWQYVGWWHYVDVDGTHYALPNVAGEVAVKCLSDVAVRRCGCDGYCPHDGFLHGSVHLATYGPQLCNSNTSRYEGFNPT